MTPYKETLVPHLVATFSYLSQIYSYYMRGDMSPLSLICNNARCQCAMLMACYISGWYEIVLWLNTLQTLAIFAIL